MVRTVDEALGRTMQEVHLTPEQLRAPIEGAPAGYEIYHDDSGRKYYYNQKTQACTWDLPTQKKF